MRPFRCQICGETDLGESRPDRCPYCGSLGHYIVSPAEWMDYGVIPITDQSKKDTLLAVEFEISNSAFYKKCSLKAETKINFAIFERLADQEEEHAELLCKMLGIPMREDKKEDAPDKDSEKFVQAHSRELRALLHYQQIQLVAPEFRVKQVFAALSDVEGEHLKISNIYR